MTKFIKLKNGDTIPRLGMGTWFLGEKQKTREQEIDALQAGIKAGVTLIDTAEMYGNGKSEVLIGEAIKPFDREKLYLVSKVYPHNAGRGKISRSLDQTLEHLGTDHLDLYLLHWRGSIPLRETVECMEEFVQQGKIKSWGVSNFDTDDMEELWSVPNGNHCVVNQVLYHLGSRGVEYDLLPWMVQHNVSLMAYCPLAQGGNLRKEMQRNPILLKIAEKHGITVMQLLLAFVLQNEHMIAIPRSGKKEHVLENTAVQGVTLSKEDLADLNKAYPAPGTKMQLDIV
ncbi:aldo/keto reductase [Clostridium sp. C105KSO13]|uniref:aldo/keto reductase n=1 Tax=Clostridium sp. C105KSO13 TaxID=1776045 RepID=UPI00074073AA|nr:aldo/keto reductase [Clostridium sp. C105KSO13]CUX51676.1 putative oxidoreductase/MSMEI_2347 [Clostridium sp. C105KSO13]